jgi:hypothetical protein
MQAYQFFVQAQVSVSLILLHFGDFLLLQECFTLREIGATLLFGTVLLLL